MDSGVEAAGRALGVRMNFEFPDPPQKGIYEDKAALQALPCSQDEFQGFQRLPGSDEAGENAQDASFRTGWHQARRRWLRI